MDGTEDSLKRQRSSDDSDDDISLVSRSPSPDDSMDVDPVAHLSKYDEYVPGSIREVITVDTKIKPTNKGFSMLAKMGWSEGQPLGLSGDGRVDPIPFEIKRDSTGLGKTSQDVRMIEETVSQRRGLDSERQTKETEEQRRAREDTVARKAAVQDEITSTLRAFYCALCDKQFKNVAQYDEHTNSYAHHHKARFKDMQANARLQPREEIDRRKEKERRREEKELRKIAAASGIRMPKSSTPITSGSGGSSRVVPSSSDLQAPLASTTASSTMDVDSNIESQGVQKKGGWASISPLPPSAPSSGFKKSGWTTVTSIPTSLPPPPPDPPRSSGWVSVSSTSAAITPPPPPPVSPLPLPGAGPTFRTGGWTSLDTGTVVQSQPLFVAQEPQPPPPSPPREAGWAPSSIKQVSVGPLPASGPVLSVPPKSIPSDPVAPPAQPVRSGWRQFQAKNSKRR